MNNYSRFLAALLAICATNSPMPTALATSPRKPVTVPREDIVLVMTNASSEKDDVDEALKKAGSEIIGSIGSGDMKVLLVKTQHGKANEVESKLSKDKKNFAIVDANTAECCQYEPTTPDPKFGAAWHLPFMSVTKAWDAIIRHPFPGEPVAVFDTGCNTRMDCDLLPREGDGANTTGSKEHEIAEAGDSLTSSGLWNYDDDLKRVGAAIDAVTSGNHDTHGHGTKVATTIAGQLENGRGAVGVNPKAAIYPIKVGDGIAGQKSYTDDLSLVAAMMVMYQKNIRIINISFSNMWDEDKHKVLFKFFKDFYQRKNGLIFVPVGNQGQHLEGGYGSPYINVVSAIGRGSQMRAARTATWASNYGRVVDFAAPGQDIMCTDFNGQAYYCDGTSLSCAQVAGVASLIWSVHPLLKNYEVLRIMIRSCRNTTPRSMNERFGYGVPDAFEAVKYAKQWRKQGSCPFN